MTVEEQTEEMTKESVVEELSNAGAEEESVTDGEELEETQEQPATEEESMSEEEMEKIVVDGNEFESIEDLKKSYKEARKKISQRNDKAKQYEQIQEVFEQRPELEQMIQNYDENMATLFQAYQNDLIDQQELQKAQQMLQQGMPQNMQQNTPNQNMPNQNPNQMNQQNPNMQNLSQQQIQQMVQQETEKTRQYIEQKMKMEQQFEDLQNEYSDVMEEHNIDLDTLGSYAVKLAEVNNEMPDMNKAFKHYIVENSNQDLFELMQRSAEDTVKEQQKQKQNAQVETTSAKQEESSENEDQIFEEMKQYIGASGGGVTK